MPILGAHVSAAGGFDKAMERAAALGAQSAQIFSGSPRVWARKPLSEVDLKPYQMAREKFGIQPVVTHSIYLINVASENPTQVEKSAKMISYDLAFDAAINGGGVVVHLGSHQGRGWEAVKDQVLNVLKGVIGSAPDGSTLLIENSAGQEGKLNSDLHEIAWLLSELKSKKVGVCIDTCHSFCAGYALGKSKDGIDISSQKSVNERAKNLTDTLDELSLWSHIKCIHVNDSRDPFGSGRDRHANLGEGVIARDDMQWFLQRPELQDIPVILEVPGFDGDGPDLENMKLLAQLAIGE